MSARRHRVLAVLTGPAELLALSQTLRAAGHTVFSASTFSGARKRLSTTSPDVLITDVRLQDFNGLHLLISSPPDTIKSAIVLDGQADAMLAVEATRLGALYLVKPVSPAELCRHLSNTLEPSPLPHPVEVAPVSTRRPPALEGAPSPL